MSAPSTHPSGLAALLPPPGAPFAVLHRPGAGHPGVEILSGPVRTAATLDELRLDDGSGAPPGPNGPEPAHRVLALVPHRQIAERGFAAPDDGTPLLAMDITAQHTVPLERMLELLPDRTLHVEQRGFDLDDDRYAAGVEALTRREIQRGEGANFVLARSLYGRIRDFDRTRALAALRRLLTAESGAYWTYLVCTGDRYLVGSSPEQQVRAVGSRVSMNPISGTYRYPRGGGPDREGLLRFLADPKEIHELYMVVDEELKMMTELCGPRVRVSGPTLAWMSRLAHTQYHLHGESPLPLTDILRGTLPAPTVTGSPVENACRVIARYEPGGRGYYSGVLALAGREGGHRALDAVIVLRTADIAADGTVRLTTGATVVRDSAPREEAAETTAKAAGLLTALTRDDTGRPPAPAPGAPDGSLGDDPAVRSALRSRNDGIASFWLGGAARPTAPSRRGPRVVVIDAEDRFTSMLAQQLRAVGCEVGVHPWWSVPGEADDPGAVLLLGPGPGDPRDVADPRVARLRSLAARRLGRRLPLAAVCLGHQAVCGVLGLSLVRLPQPRQGARMNVRLWGRDRRVGFYNSFTARSDTDRCALPGPDATARVWRRDGPDVIALDGPGLATVQFHAESLLTEDGPQILRELVDRAGRTERRTGVLTSRRAEEHA
ncbi:anthranilate synthase family protein [Streptomyces sp. NPDC006193]|uniref:anthranilate synthase family protein n=1 Tax=Streptomyces sp. NPDC006193 TaxID=3155717 RepID=UPI0033ADA8CA